MIKLTRLFDLPQFTHELAPRPDVLCWKSEGKWIKYSTEDYIQISNYLSVGLMIAGFSKGDKVLSISENRPEWNFLDMALTQIGAIQVPVYPTISETELIYLANHCDAKAAFVSGQKYIEKINAVKEQIPSLESSFSFDTIEGVNSWTELLDSGKEHFGLWEGKLLESKANITPDDLATIIYTSGTTGFPKGVMLSHRNFISNLEATPGIHQFKAYDKSVSFLPLCHVLERTGHYLFMLSGVSVYYVSDISLLASYIKEVKPNEFITVPRVFEKIYDAMVVKGRELPFLKKQIFFWAMALAEKYELDGKNGKLYQLKFKIADKLIFSKWREALGGNLSSVICGGATLRSQLERTFWAAGVKVQNGYGMTETAPIITGNTPESSGMKFGTVGRPVVNVEVKIAADGEILCKGGNVMMGYYKDPEMTAQVIDKEGWLHTGDIGMLDEEGYLKITDRKKEIFKLSTGKYIAPQVIENVFRSSPFIEQIMVIGEGEKFAAAIIQPQFDYLKRWCELKHITVHDIKTMMQSDRIIARFQHEIDLMNHGLGHIERIKKFVLVHQPWSIDTGELTSTLKLKRKAIVEKYSDLVHHIYSRSSAQK